MVSYIVVWTNPSGGISSGQGLAVTYYVPHTVPTGVWALAGQLWQSDGNINTETDINISLPAGTYTITATVLRANNRGILTINDNTSDVATIDLYNAGSPPVENIQTVGVSIAQTTKIKLIMKSKNVASTAYYFVGYAITFERTA